MELTKYIILEKGKMEKGKRILDYNDKQKYLTLYKMIYYKRIVLNNKVF